MVCSAQTAVIILLHCGVTEQDHWHQLSNEFHYISYSIFTFVVHVCFLLTDFSLCVDFLHQYHPSLFPTLASLMQFHPQRWRADSYNYPSVCEMNHWAADWAAWWETSILSSTTECSPPSTPSLCWCPGLARVHTHCHRWERKGVVCNRCMLY